MVPVIPADKNTPQKANQQFLNSNGVVVATCPTNSESVYHPLTSISTLVGFRIFGTFGI